MENLYIESKIFYSNSKFEEVKEILKNNIKEFNDSKSFVDIEYSNYIFMLNEILNLDIYITKRDDLLEKRIDEIEKNIEKVIKGFKFKRDREGIEKMDNNRGAIDYSKGKACKVQCTSIQGKYSKSEVKSCRNEIKVAIRVEKEDIKRCEAYSKKDKDMECSECSCSCCIAE
ncbi:MAG: hypothetical protein ACRDDY_16170 [Clostridium sp.]|uniref:hypothetical protein n=1 Tax=Clostridium sp. TaxID=1506 RepID=UPI003EE5DF22